MWGMRVVLAWLCWYGASSCCSAFTTSRGSASLVKTNGWMAPSTTSTAKWMVESSVASSSSPDVATSNKQLKMPLTVEEMIQQVASVVLEAAASSDGADSRRQIVRILLPRDLNNANLGNYYESEDSETTEFVLVPPDESWQGGIMQLYRSAVPTCEEILKNLSNTFTITGIPPKINEDRTIDESGVDGVGLLTTTTTLKKGTVSAETNESDDAKEEKIICYVQPLQETVPTILRNVNNDNSGLTVLVNPQWRLVDDALDSASQMDGFFGAFASFLGGKGGVLKQLSDADFQSTYILEGYVCKGRNVRLLKTFNSAWTVWAETDNSTTRNPEYKLIGSVDGQRPSYQDIESMFDDFTTLSL